MNILNASGTESIKGGASFSLRSRLVRAVWTVCWLLLASWTPPSSFRWRRILLLAFGAKMHSTARVYSSARVWMPSNLVMEDYSCIGPKVNVYNMAQVYFEEFSLASQGAHICTGTHDISDPAFQLQAFPIRIGRRSWLAAESFVGPAVTVGEGAVLGARGCAFRDLDPWAVYVGNPAVLKRKRCLKEFHAL